MLEGGKERIKSIAAFLAFSCCALVRLPELPSLLVSGRGGRVFPKVEQMSWEQYLVKNIVFKKELILMLMTDPDSLLNPTQKKVAASKFISKLSSNGEFATPGGQNDHRAA